VVKGAFEGGAAVIFWETVEPFKGIPVADSLFTAVLEAVAC